MNSFFAWFRRLNKLANARQPTLRFVMIITFSGVALTMVVLLSLFAGGISARQLEVDARYTLTLLATQMATRIEDELSERFNEILLIAATDVTLRTPGLPPARKGLVLEKLQELHPDYAWIGFVDLNGRILAATDGLLVGENVGERRWFQAGKSAPFLGDLYEALLLAQLLTTETADQTALQFVDFAVPVVDDNGTVLGVLGAHLDWQWARDLEQRMLQPVDMASNVEIFLSTLDGTPLLTPLDWQGDLLRISDPLLRQRRGTLVGDWPDGERYVTSFTTIQPSTRLSDLHWLIFVRQPVRTAYAPALRTQWQIFVLGALFAGLFAWIAWWLANRLTRQLTALTNAAESIRQGDGGTIPILTGTIEVATLSTSLNQLIADLTTAAEAERNRIARELHDSVTQTLFSTSMLADVLPKLWETDPVQALAKLEQLRLAVRGALAEMRTLLLELRPSAIADADIQQLMRQLADSTTGRTGVTVTWWIEGTPHLSADRKVVIYRTMQEALHNIVKHAEATTARLLLRGEGNTMELIIADDGCGFEDGHITSDHFGLKMMRERVEASGGTLRIESQLDDGTVIYVAWKRS